jgi:hypothetical protein
MGSFFHAPEEHYVNRKKQMKMVDVLQRSTIRKLNSLPPLRTLKKKLTRAKTQRRKDSAFCRQTSLQKEDLSICGFFSADICVNFFFPLIHAERVRRFLI